MGGEKLGKEIRMQGTVELRSVQPEGEGQQEKRTLTGYIALFDTLSEDLGWFREKIAKGAFTESIAKDDIRALVNHDPNLVLGRNRAGTLRLREDEKGLVFEVDLPDTTWAKDYAESVRRGDITQCSFGFMTDSDTWDYDSNPYIRTLNKVSLFDVSPIVTYPAYTDTSTSLRAKGEDVETPEELFNKHEAERKKENEETKEAELRKLEVYEKELDLRAKKYN